MLDVGTGSGVLGLGIAAHTRASRVCLLDYNPAAMKQAQANSALLRRTGAVSQWPALRLVQARFRPALVALLGPHDVLVSNPPYFPAAFLENDEHSTRLTDDLGLTEALIRYGLDFAADVYFTCSSTVGQEVNALAASAGVAHRMAAVASWSAPFPVELLTTQGLRRFRGEGPDPRWRAWHDVHIMHMTRRPRELAGADAG